MNSYKALILALLTLPFFSLAQESEESYKNWEKIVSELRADSREALSNTSSEDIFEDVTLSAGAGLAFAYLNLNGDGFQASGLLNGVALNFGISLFHPSLFAEGAFRSYSTDSLSNSINARLQEFDLGIISTHKFQTETLLRVGAGVSARYLDVSQRTARGPRRQDYTTPSAVFTLGVAKNFGKVIQIGPDVSYRMSLVSDTIDKSSADLNIRLSARF